MTSITGRCCSVLKFSYAFVLRLYRLPELLKPIQSKLIRYSKFTKMCMT